MSKLFIINYGIDMTSDKLPDVIKAEDERLMAAGRATVDRLSMGKGALMVSEVLHANVPTLNNWRYMADGLAAATASFYKTTLTPFLMHHNDGTGCCNHDAVAIGSNVYAEYISSDIAHPMGTAAGYVKVVTFIPESSMIGTEKALDLIQARRLMALSAGANVASKDFLCSICGKPIRSSDCEHTPGRLYDGKQAVIDIYNPRFIEYSAVYDSADIVASIRRVDLLDAAGSTDRESIVDQNHMPLHMSFFDTTKVFASASIPQETSMDIKDILKLESQGKLHDAVLAMSEELKSRDRLIGSLSDTVVALTKTKDTVDASAAVSEPAAAAVSSTPETVPTSGETSATTSATPETSTVENPETPAVTPSETSTETPETDAAALEALQKENEELKAKLAEKAAADGQPAAPASTTTESTTVSDAVTTPTSDVHKPASIMATLRGLRTTDVSSGNKSIKLSRILG